MPAWAVLICISGPTITYTPPARARSLSPETKLSQALTMATSDEEQAVSIERQGPCKFRKYEMRPARIDIALPVKPCALTRCCGDNMAYSLAVHPTKTPHFFPDNARATYPALSIVCQ